MERTGRLVLVATPIGNLEDLSPRAVRALAEADVIAAEDTRHSGKLLAHAGVRTRMLSHHEHNEEGRIPQLLDRVEAGETVAVITDAGTPGVADPGFRLVRAAVQRGLPVEAVPGPVAAIQALVLSGLPTDRFAFEGFLPRKSGPRRARLERVAADDRTLVFYLAPHRAVEELGAMVEVLGDRDAALARELTKRYEEVVRATLSELVEPAGTARGELTLVVAGADPSQAPVPGAGDLAERVRDLIASGVHRKEAIARVADAAGIPKREVFQAVVDHKPG
jgi:16S rRNA (cytidine1402-2'-O)-methyltransferase